MPEEEEESFINKLKKDRGAALMALVALLLIILGVFAVLGGAVVVTLNPPTNLQAKVVDSAIRLTWDHSIDYADPCIGYNAYLSTAAGQLGVLQNVEPVADNTYTVRDVSPGTYYATVRCTDINGNEDGNLNQLEINVEIKPPSDLSIIINDNAEYTNKRDVTLALSAKNAEECTYANEDMAWASWGPYTVEKQWTLTENTGGMCEEKEVYYKCRRSGLESNSITDTIILDTLPPAVSFNVLSVNGTLFELQIFALDDCVGDVDCYVFAGDQQLLSIPNVPGEVIKTLEIPYYDEFYLTVSCMDDAGNAGSAALDMKVELPKNITNKTTFASIKINNDAPTTTDLNVKLTLSAAINGQEPEEVYYSSDEMGTEGPERYMTSRSWVLDKAEPNKTRTYTVCYKAKTGTTEANACDSIQYVVEEEGDGGGGGGGGGGDGNQPPKNLRIEIIGMRPAFIGSGNLLPYLLIYDTTVTRWTDVHLNLSSSGATECKFWEEPPPGVNITNPEDAAPWNTTYTNGIVSFSLYPKIALGLPNYCGESLLVLVPDGLRTVWYKCRNTNGEVKINDTIWYDSTRPSKVTNLSGEYSTSLGNLFVVNIQLKWTPSFDNSWNWTDYADRGVKLYTIERYYTLNGDVSRRVYTLDPEDYTPTNLGCPEGQNFVSLECTFTDLDLPSNLTSNGGRMCYKVSAWDFVGLQSCKEEVCVDVPGTGEVEGPQIEWVAIYSSLFGTPGKGQPGGPAPSGDEYTQTTAVRVDVQAKAADECKIRNDGLQKTEWSDWMGYDDNPTSYPWTLLDKEGKRIVQVQCKNENATSTIKSDSIILDYTPPQPPQLIVTPRYVETSERNWIYITWAGFSDPISGIEKYILSEYTKKLFPTKGQLEPVWTETGNWTMNASQTSFYDYQFVKDTTYQYRIVACDNAGNCNPDQLILGEVTPPNGPYYIPGD